VPQSVCPSTSEQRCAAISAVGVHCRKGPVRAHHRASLSCIPRLRLDHPDVTFRPATRDDVPALVRLLADAPLGAKREANVLPLPASDNNAFEATDREGNKELIVVESADKARPDASASTKASGSSRRTKA
jgi:hypothetical protein